MTVPPLPEDTPQPSVSQTSNSGHNINVSGQGHTIAGQDIHIHHHYAVPSPQIAHEQEQRALSLAQADTQASWLPNYRRRLINTLPRRYDAITPFYGRAAQQATVQKYIQDGARLITIHARAGAGKTALACKVLGDLVHRPDLVDGIVALSAGDLQKQVSLDRIVSDFAQLLADGALIFQPSDISEQKVTALLTALQGGRYVLLIDNLESLLDENDALHDADLQMLLTEVLKRGGLVVVTTTRQRPRLDRLVKGYERAIALDSGLAEDDALAMLRGLDGDKRLPDEDALPRDLIQRVSGFPRALEATMGLLADSPTLTLNEILQDTGLFEGEVTTHIVERALATLPPLSMKVMEALALYGQPVTLAAVEYLLAPYVDWSGLTIRAVLDRLIERRFVSYNASNHRYGLHPLDQNYCARYIPEGTPDDAEDKRPAYTRYRLNIRAARFFEMQRKPQTEWKTLADLDPQLSEFEYRMRVGQYETAVELLLTFDVDCLLLWGHATLMVSLHEGLTEKISNSSLAARQLGSLGSAYHLLGELNRAIIYHEQGLTIAHEINDRPSEITLLGNLGQAYRDLGKTYKAIDYHKQALTIARDIDDKRGQSKLLGNLGVAYRDLGQTPIAIDYLDQALAIARGIGDKRGQSKLLGNLGVAYRNPGKTHKAIEYHEQALTIAREIHDKHGEGTQLGNLGVTYRHLGQIHQAIEYHEQALTIAREIHDRRREGTQLGNLGVVYRHLGQTHQAIEYHEQALTIARKVYDRRREGTHLGNLGVAYSDLGEIHKAIDYLEQALTIAREISDKRSEGTQLGYLGHTYIQVQNYTKGTDTLQQSLQITQEIQDPRITHLVDVYLAQAHLLYGNLQAAMEAIQLARSHDFPDNNHNAAVVYGLIALRADQSTTAQMAFSETFTLTDMLLKQPQFACDMRYARALAQCGLALITDTSFNSAQVDYEIALHQCSAKGVVRQQLRLLEQLALTPNAERLEPLLALLRQRL